MVGIVNNKIRPATGKPEKPSKANTSLAGALKNTGRNLAAGAKAQEKKRSRLDEIMGKIKKGQR